MALTTHNRPSWDALYEFAEAQEGYFTAQQALQAGYSAQLLRKHRIAGRIAHIRHGIYRLVHFPSGSHEELVVVWLWSKCEGIFSHETALSIHDLSDALPNKVHLTVPLPWTSKRLRVPDGVTLHFGNVSEGERHWFGAVPVTSPQRTMCDCALNDTSPELLRQAALQALSRKLVTRRDLRLVETALKPFGGIAA